MKIKEVSAGVKIVKDYNSYSLNLSADLDENESAEDAGGILIERAFKIISEKINSATDSDGLVEIGAAWPSKKSDGALAINIKETGKWDDIKLDELEKTPDGYKQKTDDGVLIFRKIPDERRTNEKMPTFRIYAEAKNEK